MSCREIQDQAVDKFDVGQVFTVNILVVMGRDFVLKSALIRVF